MGKYAKRDQRTKSEGVRVGSRAGTLQDEAFATRAASHARQLFTEEVAQRVGNPAKELGKLAHALRSTSEQLNGSFGAPYIGRAADQVDRVTELLERADGREVVESVERFAREQPIAFLSGAFALGLSMGRFLKSSAQAASSAELTSVKPRSTRERSTPFQSRGNQS